MKALLIAIALAGCGSKKAADPPPDPTPVANEPVTVKVDDPDDSAKVAANAPYDEPLLGTSAAQEAKVRELTDQARKTYPDAKARYLKRLPAGESFFAVATLTSPGKKETVFIAVSGIQGTKISGTIASDIMSVAGFKAHDPYTFDESELVDWLISKPDGSEEGNLVGKYLDTLH